MCDCHETYGAHLRGKGIQLGRLADRDRGKKWDRELNEFYDATRQGIHPESTRTADIRRAVEASDRAGVAFDAGAM